MNPSRRGHRAPAPRARGSATAVLFALVVVLGPAGTGSAEAAAAGAAGQERLASIAPASATSAMAAAWGDNEFGQLGNGTDESKRQPLPVSNLSEATAIDAGTSDGLALLSGGTAMSWGDNFEGRLGNGSSTGPEKCGETPCSTIPVPVSELEEVQAVAGGGEFGLALLSNGTVMAWGSNQFGQLGDDSTQSSDVPVQVSKLTEVVAIEAGVHHALALLRNGTVEAWGDNSYGELGDGTFSGPELCGGIPCSKVPVPVSGLSGVTALAAGGEFSLALLSSGKVVAWGDNEFGELGITGTENSDTPAGVVNLSEVSAIAAGDGFSLALLKDGTVMSWGSNTYGELGDDLTGFSDVPAKVSNLSEVSAIAAGAVHGLALLKAGTVMAWGGNQFGQLGNGTAESSDVPVKVLGLSQATAIAAGGFSSLAFGVVASPTVTKLEPTSGPAGGGTSVTISGTNLTGATAVKFGSTSAKSFTVDSENSISAVSPAGTGTVDVTVTTPSGTSPTGPADRFSYGPTVTAVEPSSGPASGGTAVTITGANLTGATSVKFGSTDAESFTVNSENSISAVSPAGTGMVDITVTTPSGTSPTGPADRFSYGPNVTAVEPSSGPASGGTAVMITGANFTGATAVKFGSTDAKSFTVNSENSISAVSPAGTGTVDVTVTSPSGTSATSPADRFSYGPTVSKVEPSTGAVIGGDGVTISGASFAGATAVKFGSINAKSFTVSSETSISAVTPPGTGKVDVTVTTPSGTSPTNAGDQFTYLAPWEHPRLVASGEQKKAGVKVPMVGWGTVTLSNRSLSSLTCVNLIFAEAANETEPTGTFQRAYGEVFSWSATSFTNTSGLEASPRCKSTAGLEAWATAEPEPEKEDERATLAEGTEAGSERLVIKQLRRRVPSLPWKQETTGEQTPESERRFFVKTGIAATSERAKVEYEEATAGVPTERRTGCYHFPALTEIVREPGFASAKETELSIKPVPKGCISVNIIAPAAGLEVPFQGTLEPEVVNGAKNSLTPSHAELKGGFIGSQTEAPSERSSEHDGRYLMSPYGRGYAKTGIEIKGFGYLREELLTLTGE
jgi:IPT/TIG domain/Regulator of chromosome condensation (RCC1) repeat